VGEQYDILSTVILSTDILATALWWVDVVCVRYASFFLVISYNDILATVIWWVDGEFCLHSFCLLTFWLQLFWLDDVQRVILSTDISATAIWWRDVLCVSSVSFCLQSFHLLTETAICWVDGVQYVILSTDIWADSEWLSKLMTFYIFKQTIGQLSK
jgi:hypothetical protein